MFDYSSLMALKELVVGQEQEEIVQNTYKGSMLNPGSIGESDSKKEVAKPNAKIEAKIGQKYQPKVKPVVKEQQKITNKKPNSKYDIWTQEEVADLPILKHDPRKQPQFQTLYRQRVGTQDVYLGLNGSTPSSNSCQQITYKIHLPGAVLKDIQIDLNDTQMVIQTKDYYLCQYFQYKTESKKTKAKFISDKNILELILPIIREDDF